MKILLVNKFHYLKGGSETYYFALKNMLQKNGHTVVDFSMKDEKNFSSEFSEYFVENIDYSSNKDRIKNALKIIYSTEAKSKFEALVLKTKPDLIHLHIFQHQLSPSILDIIKKYKIPTVYTSHDFKMACPNYQMMHHGIICEDCKNGSYFSMLKNRCVKNSLLKTSINFVEVNLHKTRKSYDVIDAIITPSKFQKRKFEEFGIEASRIHHIPNFLDTNIPEISPLPDKEQYLLYLGRLSHEKGVSTLINAIKGTDVKLKIVGTGPLKQYIKDIIQKENVTNAEVLGFKTGQELLNLVGNAKAVVVPSEWYENNPYSVIESLKLSRPIIGANIGGIPELVDKNGYTFESGNATDLKDKIMLLNSATFEEYEKMKQASFKKFNDEYVDTYHYEKLMELYNRFVSKEH